MPNALWIDVIEFELSMFIWWQETTIIVHKLHIQDSVDRQACLGRCPLDAKAVAVAIHDSAMKAAAPAGNHRRSVYQNYFELRICSVATILSRTSWTITLWTA
jgi:hypothetical protein